MTDIVERARADVMRSGTWADKGSLILEMADEIERLRAAIAAEREACAKIAEPEFSRPCDCETCYCDNYGDNRDTAMWDEGARIAAAIRNRSQP